MGKQFAVAVGWLLVTSSLMGCQAGGTSQAAVDPATSALAAPVENEPGKPNHEYRAVCEEIGEHNGRPYILTKWLDSRAKAYEYGSYHGDFKSRGHRWKIEERVKADPSTGGTP